MRVYELGRELGIESKEVIARLAHLGLELNSALASVDEETADRLRDALSPSPRLRDPTAAPAKSSEAATGPDDTGKSLVLYFERFDETSRSHHAALLSERWDSAQDPSDVFERTALWILLVYLVLNRVIPDGYVLPFGASIRVYEIVLLGLFGVWVLWMVVDPHPFPVGFVGLFGLGLLTVLILAPFVNALDMTPFQANGAERGIMRVFLFTGLFLSAYHLSFRLKTARLLLGLVLAVTALQAVTATWEYINVTPLTLFETLSESIGLIADPNSIRSDSDDLFMRLTGEVRAVSTAPHPIVLSSVLALGALIAGGWILNERGDSPRRWLMLSLIPVVLALPVSNSRTGFVILVGSMLPLLILSVRNFSRVIPWMLAGSALLVVAFAISPATPRLLLNSFTNPGSDPNAQVRLERFQLLPELVADHPFIGMGYLTHDPGIQIFDNAYNLALVETGMVGLALFVLFFLAVLMRNWNAFPFANDAEAVFPFVGVAAALSVLLGGLTFDAWTFDQFLPTALIVMGVASGRSRLIHDRTLL